MTLLPGTLFSRLEHRRLKPQPAQARLQTSPRRGADGKDLLKYTLDMSDVPRRLVIWFEAAFPHRIEGWEEHGRTHSGNPMVTRARRTHVLMLDYWNRHANRDRLLRMNLGLEADG